MVVIKPEHVRYLSGFWGYSTRPEYASPRRLVALVVPASGQPTLIVPKIEFNFARRRTWLTDVRLGSDNCFGRSLTIVLAGGEESKGGAVAVDDEPPAAPGRRALGWTDRSLKKKRSAHVWNPHYRPTGSSLYEQAQTVLPGSRGRQDRYQRAYGAPHRT
ncbi:aminopeptidase P family N-terminal domain-containing protein [Caballeronia zhejiangensis]|uniref:aminopeptidase P family N-terminal domain-containing protein n=1 Tax=Caballeronia zhejiangensis TaxID=871203 RepID=UPI003CC7F40E